VVLVPWHVIPVVVFEEIVDETWWINSVVYDFPSTAKKEPLKSTVEHVLDEKNIGVREFFEETDDASKATLPAKFFSDLRAAECQRLNTRILVKVYVITHVEIVVLALNPCVSLFAEREITYAIDYGGGIVEVRILMVAFDGPQLCASVQFHCRSPYITRITMMITATPMPPAISPSM
jgi:hypothetical protein